MATTSSLFNQDHRGSSPFGGKQRKTMVQHSSFIEDDLSVDFNDGAPFCGQSANYNRQGNNPNRN